MSETERRRRINYKKNRKKLITIQASIILVVALLVGISLFVYNQLNKIYYIDYSEQGNVDYKVALKPNEFYEETLQPSGQAYVSTLIDKVYASFNYQMDMDASNVVFEYAYDISAVLEIRDNRTDEPIFRPQYEIKPETKATQSSNSMLGIRENIVIDYNKYNDLANKFIDTYDLRDTTSTLTVSMNVAVVSSSEHFGEENENSYTVSLNIPLTSKTLDIKMTTTAPAGESRVLAYTQQLNQDIFKVIAIVLSVIDLLLGALLVAFIYATRNHDINYTIKVQKIVSSYKSFIQRITNGFDIRGYQVLIVGSFVEMLGIRDTIQSPILMSENTDQTRTQFFIPTNTKILYMFEIKVDNYDELYGSNPEWVDDSIIDTEQNKREKSENAAPVLKESVKSEPLNIAKPISVGEAEKSKPANETSREEPFACPFASLGEKNSESPSADRAIANAIDIVAEAAKVKALDAVVKEATPRVVESAIKETGCHTHEATAQPTPASLGVNIPEVIEHKVSFVDSPFNMNNGDTAELVVAKLVDRLGMENLGFAKRQNESKAEIAEEPVAAEEPDVIEDVAVVEEPTVVEVPEVIEEAPIIEVPLVLEESVILEEAEPVDTSEPLDVPAVIEEISAMPLDIENEKSSDSDDDDDDDGSIVYYDEIGNKLDIKCRRSCLANIIQSDNETIKKYYSDLKNYILSYKTVKARMSWRYETFKKGRYQLFRLKIRGKTICLYCALDPSEFDPAKYFHEASDAKMFEQVPMLIRIRSDRGLKKAKELIDITMERFGLKADPKAKTVDYVAEHPYERTQALIDRELIKVLIPEGYIAIDPHHIIKAEALKNGAISETSVNDPEEAADAEIPEDQLEEAIEAALASPDVELEEIDYVDEIDEDYDETEQKPGVEVIGVVWNEREHNNRIYRYDPNGEVVGDGDIVLVPTKSSSKEIVRKAAVAHGNHKVDPDMITHPLKKIISVVKRKMEDVLSGK